MSLTAFNEIHEGRGGGDQISDKERSVVDYTRKFRAITSSPFDGPDVVLAAMDRLGTPHPANPRVFLRRRQVENHAKSKMIYLATASYSSDPIVSPDPQSDPVQYEWDTNEYNRCYEYDKDGNGTANSAGQPFVPPPSDTDAFDVVNIQRNLSFIPVWLLNYRNSINSDAINIDGIAIPPLCGWLKRIHIGHVQQRNNQPYRALTFTIACKDGHSLRDNAARDGGALVDIRDDWKKYVLDKGNLAIPAAAPGGGSYYGPPMPVPNPDGTTARVPCCLDGYGHALVGTGVNGAVAASQMVYIAFHLKPEKPFLSLPLW